MTIDQALELLQRVPNHRSTHIEVSIRQTWQGSREIEYGVFVFTRTGGLSEQYSKVTFRSLDGAVSEILREAGVEKSDDVSAQIAAIDAEAA